MRSRFSSFPSNHLHEHKEFLDKYLLGTEKEISPDSLWSQLYSYWNFITYDLLKNFIRNAGRKSLGEEMKRYETNLKRFLSEVSFLILLRSLTSIISEATKHTYVHTIHFFCWPSICNRCQHDKPIKVNNYKLLDFWVFLAKLSFKYKVYLLMYSLNSLHVTMSLAR